MSKGRFTALLMVILAAAIILRPPQEKTVYVIINEETGQVQYAENEIPQETECNIEKGTATVIAVIIILFIIWLISEPEIENL